MHLAATIENYFYGDVVAQLSLKKLILLTCLISISVKAETVEEFLMDFHKNPKKAMEKLPAEVDKMGNAHARGYIDYNFVRNSFADRKAVRDELTLSEERSSSLHFFNLKIFDTNKDVPEIFVEPGHIVKNLKEMETLLISKSKLPTPPYSDSYWPTYKGIAGIRYADPDFPNSKVWLDNFSYIQARPALDIMNMSSVSEMDKLSPAEKYDIAMGDSNFNLTNFVWNKGKKNANASGVVPTWMGYCHGWSAAAQMMQEYPQKSVTIKSPTGAEVVFHPQDARALTAMLWANASPPTRYAGNRCNIPNPPKNEVGRVIDPSCYDVSPSTWHISMVNQLGIHHRSFSIDSTVDDEVWNYPVASYEYKYFNPQNFEQSNRVEAALLPIEKFSIDKFPEFRNPKSKFVIGVIMNITYANAISASRKPLDEPSLKTLRLIYDLELDDKLNIVGGEWYLNSHPDFIWTFEKNTQAQAKGENNITQPTLLNGSVPNAWTPIAETASAIGEPLYLFIKALNERGRSQ